LTSRAARAQDRRWGLINRCLSLEPNAMKTYDDVFKTPGAVSWTELLTSDPKAAVEFYGGLFGWKYDAMQMGPDAPPYQVIKIGDAALGGIMQTPLQAGAMPPAWAPYVTVADIEATRAKTTSLGGQCCTDVMEVPGVGKMCVIADPQGATINIIQYTGG
jgi:uncharacterized protein